MSNNIATKVKNLIHNKVVKNAGWMVGEQLVQMVISLIIGMITARYLGPSNYGVINYCAAYVAFFTSICSLGLEGIAVKELVNNPKQEGEIVGTGMLMRIVSGILSIVAIFILLFILDDGDPIILRVGFLQSLVLVFKAGELFDYWFQSKLQSKYVAILKSISYVLVACYKVYILVMGKSVEWFAFSTSLDFLLIFIMIVFAYFKKGGSRLNFSMDMSKRLISQSYHFILSNLIVTVYSQMDKIMIGQFLDDTQVGLYSAAITICNYWIFIPTAIINSSRPSIMELKKLGNEEKYLKRIKQLYALLIYSSLFVSVFISLLSRWIISFLYGDAYILAVKSLIIAIWYTLFSVLGTARGIWIVCENKNKYVKKYVLWGAIINIILNYLLIPVWGIEGAAVATLITQIVTCLIAPLFYKDTRIHTRYVLEAFILKGVK